MALSEKHRSSIYQGLHEILGDEETEALLSQFPARDLDVPVTKEFVRAEIAEVRTEIADLRSELRAEMHEGFGSIRAEMNDGFGSIRAELHQALDQMNERLRQQTIWVAGALVAAIGSSAGIAAGVASLVG